MDFIFAYCFKKFVRESLGNPEGRSEIEAYFDEAGYYRSENFWREFWQRVDPRLQSVIGITLLKKVCKNPYDYACRVFQNKYEPNRKEFNHRYETLKSIEGRVQQLKDKGYEEGWSWRTLHQIARLGYEQESREDFMQLIVERKRAEQDELAVLRTLQQFADNGYDEGWRVEFGKIALGQRILGRDELEVLRFFNGKLIYKPNRDSDKGKIEFPFARLSNPLEGIFDLSGCNSYGAAAEHISINAGYRKRKNPLNGAKLEIWFAPRFLIERDFGTTASYFRRIMNEEKWPLTAAVGIFWTMGEWPQNQVEGHYFDYITNQDCTAIGAFDLDHLWRSIPSGDKCNGNKPVPKYHSFFSCCF